MSEIALFTPRGIQKYDLAIAQLEAQMTNLESQLGETAQTGGNQWHDNASFDHLTADIRVLNERISKMRAAKRNAQYADRPRSDEVVAIGTQIQLTRNGVEEEWYIGGFGESDFDLNIIAYNTPLAQLVLGKKVGDIATGPIGRGLVELKILQIKISEEF